MKIGFGSAALETCKWAGGAAIATSMLCAGANLYEDGSVSAIDRSTAKYQGEIIADWARRFGFLGLAYGLVRGRKKNSAPAP